MKCLRIKHLIIFPLKYLFPHYHKDHKTPWWPEMGDLSPNNTQPCESLKRKEFFPFNLNLIWLGFFSPESSYFFFHGQLPP